jgi:hypothetical protein
LLVLVALAYDEVWSSLLYLRRVWRRARTVRAVCEVFWRRVLREAEEVALMTEVRA